MVLTTNLWPWSRAEVYVSDFGLARAQEAEGQVATTKQNFGPIAVHSPRLQQGRAFD